MRAVLALLFSVLTFAAGSLQAEQRIALVLGNSSYGSVSPLDNPARDARLMRQTLEGLGFEVTMIVDGTQIEMKRGIAQFGRDLRQAGTDATGLFYYAGHGVQSFGTNYLLPVDVVVNDAADLDLVAIEAQSVLRQMYSAKNKTNIVILDACRNNPFSEIPEFNDNGLAEMQAPTGTFLAYATAPGAVALDGLDGNSPFTKALAEIMPTPGMQIEQVFKKVRVDVISQTNGLQTPWDASSLTTDFTFAKAAPVTPAELEAEQFWITVKAARDPVQIMLFLRGYGDSKYVEEAKALLATLLEQELAGSKKKPEPPVASAPSENERKMFEMAQADPSEAAYEAYLQTYPNGTFAEFAETELAALRSKNGTDPVGPGPDEVLSDTVKTTGDDEPVTRLVTFSDPLVSESEAVNGFSIEDLIARAPTFPPIEGLPESYWKGQDCSSCHEWTRERICTQAKTYLSLNTQRSLTKAHPFGGALKRNLKAWAANDCQ